METILAQCSAEQRQRICGIGIGTPFELWRWNELVGAPAEEFISWKDVDFVRELARFTDLPVSVVNDATAGSVTIFLDRAGDTHVIVNRDADRGREMEIIISGDVGDIRHDILL